MMLEKVTASIVHLSFTREDCALLAHILRREWIDLGGRPDNVLIGMWLDAAACAFEAAALTADASGFILDTVRTHMVRDEDQARFSPDALHAEAAALLDPETPPAR